MKFENIALEWKECRKTVARFDNYLLRLRLLGFSVFTLTFTAIVGAAGSTSEKITFTAESLLLAIMTLSLFVLAIYILDRYYERMLLIAVLRASRLESHRLEGFRMGLTTEIEFQKRQLNKPSIVKTFARASVMVNFVYALIFIVIWAQYLLLIRKGRLGSIYLWILVGIIFLISLIAFVGNFLLREPSHLIAARSHIVNSPVIMSREEIRLTIARIAREIVQWLEKENEHRLHIVSILIGARPFSKDLLDEIKEINPKIELILHFIHMEAQSTESNYSKDCKIVCGILESDILKDKTILVIDDLLDTGTTLKKVLDLVNRAGPKTVKSAVFVKKFDNSIISPDFIGFNFGLNREKLAEQGLEDCWLFGYGMDFDGHYREIEHIGWVRKI
jgi:hypoxanthine phosphoribosyltransferase